MLHLAKASSGFSMENIFSYLTALINSSKLILVLQLSMNLSLQLLKIQSSQGFVITKYSKYYQIPLCHVHAKLEKIFVSKM